jgi:hypothetical protein
VTRRVWASSLARPDSWVIWAMAIARPQVTAKLTRVPTRAIVLFMPMPWAR